MTIATKTKNFQALTAPFADSLTSINIPDLVIDKIVASNLVSNPHPKFILYDLINCSIYG